MHGESGNRLASQTEHYAKSAADRYLGLTAAERRWYAKLGVDPYTDNDVLHNAVKRLAKVDAAATFGMRFAPVGIPGEVNRALDAIYSEDPAVLRKRRHEELAADGLTETEVVVRSPAGVLNHALGAGARLLVAVPLPPGPVLPLTVTSRVADGEEATGPVRVRVLP